MPIRVVLADDHPTLLLGVRTVLEATGAMIVAAEAHSPEALIDALSRITCDILVMDYLMPDDACATEGPARIAANSATKDETKDGTKGAADSTTESTTRRDGLYLLRAVRRTYPRLPIVVFTMLKEARVVDSVIRLGAKAVLCKTDPIDLLPKTLRLVLSGHLLMRPRASHAGNGPISRFPRTSENQSFVGRLSRREAAVVRMLLSGQSLQEVARHFERSAKTISNQKRSAMQKLGVSNDIELARLAAEAGFY